MNSAKATLPTLDEMRGLDPNQLASFLIRHGWKRTGGQVGIYERFGLSSGLWGTEAQDIILPLDSSWADFDELLMEMLLRVEQVFPTLGDALRRELLERSPGDQLKFRKEVTTIRGAVAWSMGKDLISSAENILLAGAKSRLSKRAYYGQANGRFAHRFLSSVLMGQTEIGSYVVTAFTPTSDVFPNRTQGSGNNLLTGIDSYTGREIAESVVSGLEATAEAISHHRSTNSMSGFEEGVRAGISREMVDAVRLLVIDSDGGDVTVDWNQEVLATGVPVIPKTQLSFEASSAAVLERASGLLASLTPVEHVTAKGRLSLVSRPKPGEPGVVRLRVLEGSEASSLQIRLQNEGFELAASAIAHDSVVQVSGRQEREGNRYWLYDAALTILPPKQQPPTLF